MKLCWRCDIDFELLEVLYHLQRLAYIWNLLLEVLAPLVRAGLHDLVFAVGDEDITATVRYNIALK